MKNPDFVVRILIEEKEGSNVAYCLEMGLVAVHDDAEALPAIMCKLISRQLEFAIRNNNHADIFHPAPPEVWEKFRQIEKECEEPKETTQHQMRTDGWLRSFEQRSYAACSA